MIFVQTIRQQGHLTSYYHSEASANIEMQTLFKFFSILCLSHSYKFGNS